MFTKIHTIAIFLIFAGVATQSIAQKPTTSKSTPSAPKPIKSEDFVEGKTIIDEVVFSGMKRRYDEYGDEIDDLTSETDLLKEVREHRANIQPNDLFELRKVENTLKVIKEYLASRGYFKAKVVALGQKTPQDRMKLIFSIERGPAITVSDFRFSENRNITNEELVATMKTCLGKDWNVYDKRHIDYCAKKDVRSLMFRRGYFNAKITAPSRRFVSDKVEISFDVIEGLRYRWGEIKVIGSKVFSEKEIIDMLGQKSGDVADGRALQDFAYVKLKSIYMDRGHILFNAEFDPNLVPPAAEGLDATANVQITIDEGPVFKINRIDVVGIDAERRRKLVQNLSIKTNDIFSQTKLEQDIKKINELKEFLPVDPEAGVEIRTDEEASDVDLIIKLTPIID